MPPELNFLPAFPVTLLCVTSVCVAPSSRMPPPLVVTGVSSFFLQSLLLSKTRLNWMALDEYRVAGSGRIDRGQKHAIRCRAPGLAGRAGCEQLSGDVVRAGRDRRLVLRVGRHEYPQVTLRQRGLSPYLERGREQQYDRARGHLVAAGGRDEGPGQAAPQRCGDRGGDVTE